MTKPTLEEFITLHDKNNKLFPSNAWIKHPYFALYVRSSLRNFTRKRTQIKTTPLDKTFDLANIIANKPGQGHFKQLLAYLNNRLPQTTFKYIYIENVMSERFATFLIEKSDYIEFDYYDTPHKYPKYFYRKINK